MVMKGRWMQEWFALNDLDRKLVRYLPHRNGTFFEAGANDGLRQSNTAYFERSAGWTGVLVEPSPILFERCRKNRSSKTQCFQAALVPPDWQGAKVELTYCDLMSVTNSPLVDLDRDEHIEKGKAFLEPEVEPFMYTAEARTIASILSEARIEHIDLFSLDLEGFEAAALRGVDFDAVKIDYVCVEAWNLENISKVLGARFDLIDKLSVHDYLFRRSDFQQI